MSMTEKTIEEINREAIGILFREMGVADTMRFLDQFIERSGDYARDRHALLGDPTVEEFFAEARRREALQNEHAGVR
jgi:pantoate kinase